MTDQQGSSLTRFKTAMIDQLQARLPNVVTYESPADAAAAMGEDGSGVAVFWLDDTTAEIALNTIPGGGPLWWDETVHPVLVFQAIGVDTSDTQAVVDARAEAAMGHAMALLASDPSLGCTVNGDSRLIRGVPESWTYTTGLDSQNQRAGRFELTVTLEARVTVEA